MGEKYWLICVNCEYLSKFLLNLNWWPWRMMSTTTINQYRHSYHMVSPGTRDCFVHIMKMHYYLLWVVTPPDKRAVKWSVTQPSIHSIPWDNGGHLQMNMKQITTKQVCIPVGCVPSACWPYPRGICISGVYLQGWGLHLVGLGRTPPPPRSADWGGAGRHPSGQTNICENITLPQTSFLGGK